MPELPEVETVKRGLEPHLLKQIITAVNIRNYSLRRKIQGNLPNLLKNRQITAVLRRAKYLIIELDNHHHLLIHLGMTGKLFVLDNKKAPKKHDHVDIKLKNGSILRYNDARRFGLISYYPFTVADNPLWQRLGPEPLQRQFSSHYLYQQCQKRNTPIKQTIMEQKIVVGVGNIYANEALYLAGIHPQRPAQHLRENDCQRLSQAIKKTLKKAIKAGGTTLKDFINPEGDTGYFQHKLLVYGRAKQACMTCGNSIDSVVLGGRNSFYCAICQPLPVS